MEKRADTYGSERLEDYGDVSHWQDNIHLLKLVQSDYQVARKQLDRVSEALAKRENLVSQRLQSVLLISQGYTTLCLQHYESGTMGSQIGRTIIGRIMQSSVLPKVMRLEVRCLNRFEVGSEWNRVDRWQSVKAKSLFQYLMTRPREPVIKEVLMENLWPDCDPQAANNNFKAAMHGLRQTLSYLFDAKQGFPYILFLQGSYRVNPEIELWIDVEQFEQHWVTGRRLEKEGKLAEATREFELAESLYRGDYLEDEPYEEWTLLRREALKDIYLLILSKLADYYMQSADYESCVVYCQKILIKDACREDAYRRLIRCYSRLGNRNRALCWYEICRRTIQAELDTIPDDETTNLYRALLRGEPL